MNDRDCSRIFAMLSEYLDRELPAATCGELETHLGECPECVEFVESLKRSIALCRQYGASRGAEALPAPALDQLREAYDRVRKRMKTHD